MQPSRTITATFHLRLACVSSEELNGSCATKWSKTVEWLLNVVRTGAPTSRLDIACTLSHERAPVLRGDRARALIRNISVCL